LFDAKFRIAPHLIIGNIERMQEHACGWNEHGSKYLNIVNEHKSDLQRCLEYMLSKPEGQQLTVVDVVLVYGAFNPRLDKLLGNISVLTSFYKQFKRIILVDEVNMVEILPPGKFLLTFTILKRRSSDINTLTSRNRFLSCLLFLSRFAYN
jgi:thiamine pyrophosphokinase